MALGPEDITLTAKTLTGGTVSASTLANCTSSLGTIAGSTFVNCISTNGTLSASTLTGCQSTLCTINGSTLGTCNITGSTFAGNLAAGTTVTAAQLKGTSTLPIAQITSSALLTTPVAGGVEYDGVCSYITAANANRHVILAPQVATITNAFVITDSTGFQKLQNGSTNGAVNVGPNITYLFEAGFEITSLSTTAGSVGFGFAGTANISAQSWQCIASNRVAATTAPSAANISNHTAASTNCVVNSATTVGQAAAFIKGKVVITTSGTLIPQIFQGTSGAITLAPQVSAGAYFVLTPIGSNVVNTVGGWT